MNRVLKIIFFAVIIKPLVLVILGLNIRNRQKLPSQGPAIIAANHNSHLDTMVLMALYPLSKIHKIRPVAAADYFLSNKIIGWFSLNVIGILPLVRSGEADRDKLFSSCHSALENGDILIVFPEGSRGEPEQVGQPKKGLFHLVKERPDTPVIPVVMHGLGRSLPRGESLFVPFNCDVVVGDPLAKVDTADEMLEIMTTAYLTLREQCLTLIESDDTPST